MKMLSARFVSFSLVALFALGMGSAAFAAGNLVSQGRLIGVNGQACRGTVGVFETARQGGDCDYVVNLQRFSVSGETSLEMVPVAGNAVLTPEFQVLRRHQGNQAYTFSGACGAVWAQIEIVNLARSPVSEQVQCVGTLMAPDMSSEE